MDFNKDLQNKIILITGGGDGIGQEICKQFSKYNCKIAFFCRTKKNEMSLKKIIKKNNKALDCLSSNFDATDEKKLFKFCNLIKKKWGGVDILINNLGGGWFNDLNELGDINSKKFNYAYTINTKLHFNLISFFLPSMIKKKWGRVIGISSIASLKPSSKPWYYIFKKSINNFYKSLSAQQKYASKNITFNVILPGAILTKKTHWFKIKNTNKALYKKISSNFPQLRIGSPVEVSNIIVFLSSSFASLVNGASIVIDGAQSNIGYESFD